MAAHRQSIAHETVVGRLLISASLFGALFLGGCMHSKPVLSWRLSNNVLIPPGISRPSISEQTVRTDAGIKKDCPSDLRRRRDHVAVKVRQNGLTSKPPGWLSAWTDDLEAQGCIAPGKAIKLANDIAESVPLELNTAFRLLYPKDPNVVYLGQNVRLQIMTPILAEGADPDAPLIESSPTVSVDGNRVGIDGRFTQSVLGYEMTWYSAEPKAALAGVSVAPVTIERHLNGQTERVSMPIRNYFQALSPAGFYAVFYKGGQTEFTAIIVGAITRPELDGRIRLLETGASCETLNTRLCVTIPKRVAINPMVLATVNGEKMFLNWGATVGSAIRAGGEQRFNDVLPKLRVYKPYRDRLTTLQFLPSDSAIFNLILAGGESISWK
jgi:hypothetical protein